MNKRPGLPLYNFAISRHTGTVSVRRAVIFYMLKLSTVSRRIEPFASRCEYSQTVGQTCVMAIYPRERKLSARRLSTVAINSQTVSVEAVSTRQKLSDTELAQENSQVDSHLKRVKFM